MADENLPELYLAGISLTEDESLDFEESLQRFTSLTRLVFDAYESSKIWLARQTSAPIAELVVIDLFNPEDFCEFDALSSLQSLHLEAHISKGLSHFYFGEYQDDAEQRESELQRAATALLSLPQLSKISGECKLISEYVVQHLHGWKQCEISSRALNLPKETKDRKLPMWVKP